MSQEQDPDFIDELSDAESVDDDAAELVDGDAGENEDIALRPGPNADDPADIDQYICADVRARYDVYSYRHAAAIMAKSFPNELAELEAALLGFEITVRDIGLPGGNESVIPKKISTALRPKGWVETRIQGDLLVRLKEYDVIMKGQKKEKKLRAEHEPRLIPNFIDGHKIDYVKGRVAFDMEWNSKDQTFDRDLYAFRAFHECGIISAAVMVTRSEKLNPVFSKIPKLGTAGQVVYGKKPKFDSSGSPIAQSVKDKFGASTTWMGKLLYRLNAGRHGGCPILVFGITPKLISDLDSIS